MNKNSLARINSTPRLFELTVEQSRDFGKYLMDIARMVGVNEPPDPEREIPILVKFIKNNFSRFTLSEIGVAFEQYCAGKLDCKAEHFGTFNLKFVGSVLNAYSNFKASEVRRYQSGVDRSTDQAGLAQEAIEKSQVYLGFIDLFEKLEKFPLTYDWASCYQFLKDQGRIKLTEAERKEIRSQVENTIRLEVTDVGGLVSTARMIEKALADNDNVQARCKAEAFKQFIFNEVMQYETIKEFATAERSKTNNA